MRIGKERERKEIKRICYEKRKKTKRQKTRQARERMTLMRK